MRENILGIKYILFFHVAIYLIKNNINNIDSSPETIAADDIFPALIGFQFGSYTVNESAEFVVVCIQVRVGSLLDRGEVQITTSDGTTTSVTGIYICTYL